MTDIYAALEKWRGLISSDDTVEDPMEEAKCIRYLRNIYGSNPLPVHYCSETSLHMAICSVKRFLRASGSPPSEAQLAVCRISLQLQFNIYASTNEEHRDLTIPFSLMRHFDAKIRNFSSALIFSALRQNNDKYILYFDSSYLKTILFATENQSEFALLTLIHLLQNCSTTWWSTNYDQLNENERIIVLDTLLNEDFDENSSINELSIHFVTPHFKTEVDKLLVHLRKDISKPPPSPREVIRLLTILCRASCVEKESSVSLQSDASLLIDTVYLLRMLHQSAGETANNWRTPASKLSDDTDETHWEHDPVYGLKRDLIRLVANLCWNNKKNQDEVREMEAIPLILDCSPIDFKNPMILQWVIFAIKSLTMGNTQNQNIIKHLEKRGSSIDPELIERMCGVRLSL